MVEINKYPMVEALVEDLRALGHAIGVTHTSDDVIAGIKRHFDLFGPYEFARQHNLLVNNSGEEFACQFMAFFNEYSGQQVY